MCTIWEIEVTNNSAVDLLVGGAAMWNDGGITGIPSKGEQFLLPAGATARIPSAKFRARPPLDAPELVAIFGTRVEDPVRWDLLTSPAFRSSKDLTGTLEKVFRKVLAGARGSDLVEEEEDLSTWTSTKLPIRVVANAQMIERSEHERRCQTEKDREYTVNDFDIRPYLPRDRNSPLRRVLETAHALAIRGNHDGIPYKQHAWTPGDDDANLAKGIDCSRAIWWAFTRAGLPYNSDDEYLWTGRMFGDETPMTEQFNECSSDDLRTGDVLVYYGTNSHGTPSGHTVMVIDPERRIAWGSHGWDGNPKLGTGMEADTGVEYQHIRNRPHWKNWDSSRMTLRACWRYKRFAGRSSRALGDLSELRCNDTTCQVVMP